MNKQMNVVLLEPEDDTPTVDLPRPQKKEKREKLQKRLNANISADQHAKLQATFRKYGMKLTDGMRIGLNFFAAALPVLARGGEIVFREKDGSERTYMFPFFTP